VGRQNGGGKEERREGIEGLFHGGWVVVRKGRLSPAACRHGGGYFLLL
jgi:hypothetical protein